MQVFPKKNCSFLHFLLPNRPTGFLFRKIACPAYSQTTLICLLVYFCWAVCGFGVLFGCFSCSSCLFDLVPVWLLVVLLLAVCGFCVLFGCFPCSSCLFDLVPVWLLVVLLLCSLCVWVVCCAAYCIFVGCLWVWVVCCAAYCIFFVFKVGCLLNYLLGCSFGCEWTLLYFCWSFYVVVLGRPGAS